MLVISNNKSAERKAHLDFRHSRFGESQSTSNPLKNHHLIYETHGVSRAYKSKDEEWQQWGKPLFEH